jgi:transposase
MAQQQFDLEQIRKWYLDEKISIRQIAKKLGIRNATAQQIIRENVSAKRVAAYYERRKITDVERKILRDMVAKDCPITDIIHAIGACHQTVDKWLKEEGLSVTRRTRPYFHFTPERIEQVYAFIDQGMNKRQIAAEFNISPSVLGERLRDHGIEMARPDRRRRMTDSERKILGEMALQDRSVNEIAIRFGIDYMAAKRWLEEENLTVSSRQRLKFEPSKEDHDRLLDLAADPTVNRTQIAHEFGVTLTTISRYFEQQGIVTASQRAVTRRVSESHFAKAARTRNKTTTTNNVTRIKYAPLPSTKGQLSLDQEVERMLARANSGKQLRTVGF